MKENLVLIYKNINKKIIISEKNKEDLNKLIDNQINTLMLFQKKLNNDDCDIIVMNQLSDIILKTEYYIFKLKSTMKKLTIRKEEKNDRWQP